MSYSIVAVPTFRKEVKKLAKKYPSLKSDLALLFESLEDDPTQGTPLGKNCFKIRLAVSSKGKGKSGGARIITNIVVSGKIIFLLSIYDKAEKENLSDTELRELLEEIID